MNEDTGESQEQSVTNWSDRFEKKEIVEVKGLKFKVSDWRPNGRLFLKLVKGGV